MKKIMLSLFIAISLLIAPIAHAADLGCKADDCRVSEQNKQSFDAEKQDHDKLAKNGHHCCCVHAYAVPDMEIASKVTIKSRTAFTVEHEATTSIVVGPPLKPPSHA